MNLVGSYVFFFAPYQGGGPAALPAAPAICRPTGAGPGHGSCLGLPGVYPRSCLSNGGVHPLGDQRSGRPPALSGNAGPPLQSQLFTGAGPGAL